MGLCYQATKWIDHLWFSHAEKFPSARLTIAEGTHKQPAFPEFSLDVHSTIYLRYPPPTKDDAPAWAADLLTQARDLPEFQQVQQRCRHNGFLAGVGAQTLLEALLPLVPQEETVPPHPDTPHGPQEGPGAHEGHEGFPGGPPGTTPGPDDDSRTRRALRQACRAVAHTLDEAQATTDALGQALGRQAGQGPGGDDSLQSLDEVRTLYALLRDHPTLAHIAQLAGRLARLGQAHKKTQVTPAVGAVKGITVGGDLDRLLPSELVGLRSSSRLLKLQTLDKILNKRALQYLWRGEESLTRGPLVVCIDESGSMGQSLDSPSVWAKAVNLALLTTATQQRRAWHMLGFSDGIRHEHHKDAQATLSPEELTAALSRQSSGGTNFEAPLRRALEVIATAPSMRQADIVFVTDGEASISPAILQEVQRLRTQEGVQLYGILIGIDADGATLAPLATALYRVSTHPQTENGTVAPLLAQVS